MKRTIIISLLCLLCGGAMQAQKIRIKTGIEVLKEQNFRCLEGKRVGLITNPTGVDNRMRSTIDILHEAPNVNLVALYGPEHGVRGDVHAGDHVTDIKDATTGLPVYSLYGKTRKATPDMLKDVDVLVYDIQDIGCRSFTYISTMGLAMEAAAENGKEFIVLDRPNPVGGLKIEGNLVEDDCISFVSQFKIPYLYAQNAADGVEECRMRMWNVWRGGNPLQSGLGIIHLAFPAFHLHYVEITLFPILQHLLAIEHQCQLTASEGVKVRKDPQGHAGHAERCGCIGV